MDADEKLLELKKAYADVILNISKEAATKVMATEKRAMRYQHEMKIAKEESLRLLMRIKQMMDSKIGEAEAASLNQQNKIVELEAQLHEAEDIVSGLREELAQVQAELQSVKNQNLHPESKRPLDNTEYPYQSVRVLQRCSNVASGAKTSYLHQRQECHKCYNKLDCTCSLYVQNQDLPSIISRGNKDSSFYRNGRTQRIRACERNVSDRETCLLKESAKVKNEVNGKEQTEEKAMSIVPFSGAKTSGEMDKNLLENAKFSSSQSFLRKRKRATRQRKPVRALNSYIDTEQFPVSGKDDAAFTENQSMETQTLSSDKDGPVQIITEAFETEEKRVENFDAGKVGELNVKLVPFEDKTGLAENLCSPDHIKLDNDKSDVPSHNLEDPSDLIGTLPSQSVRERVIKYTFQRKRKKPALAEGSEAKHSLDTESKLREKQDGNKKSEQSKYSSVTESPRECRRMAQVARQLLSLSDRKWWD